MNSSTSASFQFNPALNDRFLKELFADDMPYAITLFESFLEEIPHCCREIQEAYEQNNTAGLKAAAHECKTLFAYVGLDEVSRQLQEMENACAHIGNTAETGSLYHQIMSQCQGAETLLATEIQRLKLHYEI